MSSDDKDLELSILTRRLFRSMSFATDLKVPMFVPVYSKAFKRSPSSDVDVLGIRFDLDFEHTIAIAEAKSGEVKAVEELLKLGAVGDYLKARKKYLVKSQVHENAREIGRNLGLVCLSESELIQLLNNIGASNVPPTTQELLYHRQQKAWFVSMRKQRVSQPLANYLESEIWVRPYWENINNLPYLLRHFLRNNADKHLVYTEFTIFRTASALSLSILHLCRQVMSSSLSNVGRAVELYIFGGPGARRQRERLRDEIQKVAPSLKGLSIPMEPAFLDDLKEVVAYFILSPHDAIMTPQIFEDAVSVVANAGGKFVSAKWPYDYSPVAIKLAKDVLQFVLKSCGYTKQSKSFSEFLAL
jgi:hypothetical protein